MLRHKDIIKWVVDSNDNIYPVIEGTYKAYIHRHNSRVRALKDRKAFADVYAIDRAFTMDYAFATTVHKAQGSEFNNVFIDFNDIKKAMGDDTYARLMYVAISRAKRRLYV